MIHAWRIVVLTTRMAVPVSESIAFSVGITMEKRCVFAADDDPPPVGARRRRTYRRCRKCGLPKKPETQ